jgi:hypothetical protein
MSRTTTRTLSGVGDPNAPVGSKEWLEYVVNYAKSTARDVSAKCGDLQKILRTMQECDAHKAAGFVSFETFLSRRVGISSDQAKAVLDADPKKLVGAVLGNHGGARQGAGRRKRGVIQPSYNGRLDENQVDNIKLKGGTQTAYLAARLRRDHPDAVFDESVRGSVRQAAIAAGIVKVPGVLEQLRKLWAKATDADRRAFMDEVGHGR